MDNAKKIQRAQEILAQYADIQFRNIQNKWHFTVKSMSDKDAPDIVAVEDVSKREIAYGVNNRLTEKLESPEQLAFILSYTSGKVLVHAATDMGSYIALDRATLPLILSGAAAGYVISSATRAGKKPGKALSRRDAVAMGIGGAAGFAAQQISQKAYVDKSLAQANTKFVEDALTETFGSRTTWENLAADVWRLCPEGTSVLPVIQGSQKGSDKGR